MKNNNGLRELSLDEIDTVSGGFTFSISANTKPLPADFIGFHLEANESFAPLQHNLFEQTVDMAIGYTLPAGISYNQP